MNSSAFTVAIAPLIKRFKITSTEASYLSTILPHSRDLRAQYISNLKSSITPSPLPGLRRSHVDAADPHHRQETRLSRLPAFPLRDQHLGLLLDDIRQSVGLAHRGRLPHGRRRCACPRRGGRSVLPPRERPRHDVLQPRHLVGCFSRPAVQRLHHAVPGLEVDVRRHGNPLRCDFHPCAPAGQGDCVRRWA